MDFLEMMPWIWGALAVLFGIVEAMTVSMVSCWFAMALASPHLLLCFTPLSGCRFFCLRWFPFFPLF